MEVDMSKRNEFLSDLIDDQCSSSDFDSLLNDKNAIECWYRYSTVNAILKDEYSANASVDFCKEISKKIADEPSIIAAPRSTHTVIRSASAEIKRFTGGLAIAASFAFATFFSVQTMQVSDDTIPVNGSTAEVELPTAGDLAATQSKQSLSVNMEDNLEQMELELFNDIFMSRARESEKDSIAPFATRVGAEYVKTIRFSAEQWQEILRRNAKNKADPTSEVDTNGSETNRRDSKNVESDDIQP